jgi:glycosyltransferase involved in cell wall biosynthesis
MIDPKKKLLYVVNVPAFFISHRLPIAIAAKKEGWNVQLITGQEASVEMGTYSEYVLADAGVAHILTAFQSIGLNPLREVFGLLQVIFSVEKNKPHIIHSASPKGNIYGGIAARLCRVPKLVVAVSGMGFLFTGQAGLAKRGIQSLYLALLSWIFKHSSCTVIVQNKDDWNNFLDKKLLKESQLVLIPGSGIDLQSYSDITPEMAEKIVVLPARMLRDKGVFEFVSAARILKEQGCTWRFALVGAADYKNPSAINVSQINAWVTEGVVEYWGYQQDMVAVLKQAGIVCLPSYREGMPKVLLEAAAAGRAIVTTDVPGCRDAICPNRSGLLVKKENSADLADALATLMQDNDKRVEFGLYGREFAVENFDINSVVSKTLSIYTDYK